MKRKDNTLRNTAIFSGSLLLALVATYAYSPVISTHATGAEAGPKASVNVGTAIAISLDKSELALQANINSFVQGTVTATVSTNSQYGYTVVLEDADDDTSMNHVSSLISDEITSTFAGAKTSSTMPDNSWGYSTDTTNFNAVPAFGSPVILGKRTNLMPTTSESISVDFGAKVGMITSGRYKDVVLFTAYVNGSDGDPLIPVHTANGGTMQDFECSTLANIHDSTTLTDSRDGSTYTVRKLKDGRCWMTENLRIANRTLTPADSNVTSNFEVPASDISSITYGATNAAYLDSTYGGYYNFYTATAGWGTESATSGNSPQDICPKGWRLPTGGVFGEYTALSNAYENSAELMKGKPGFNFPGHIENGVMDEKDKRGEFWSSSPRTNGNYSASYAEVLEIYYSYNSVSVTGGGYKKYGFPIRCIAK